MPRGGKRGKSKLRADEIISLKARNREIQKQLNAQDPGDRPKDRKAAAKRMVSNFKASKIKKAKGGSGRIKQIRKPVKRGRRIKV